MCLGLIRVSPAEPMDVAINVLENMLKCRGNVLEFISQMLWEPWTWTYLQSVIRKPNKQRRKYKSY